MIVQRRKRVTYSTFQKVPIGGFYYQGGGMATSSGTVLNSGALEDYFWFPVTGGGDAADIPVPAVGIITAHDGGVVRYLLAKTFDDAVNFLATDPDFTTYVGDPVMDYPAGGTSASFATGDGSYYTATGLVPPLDLGTQLFEGHGFPGAYGTVAPNANTDVLGPYVKTGTRTRLRASSDPQLTSPHVEVDPVSVRVIRVEKFVTQSQNSI